ncbi:MAG: acyl-CoA N-acyltransferase [Lentinula lateritia]|nr:MAG: acyl-CoA N-acyltransferase [Lentinula lateritia]
MLKDDNFCFPIPEGLETEKLGLVPFVPSLHASIIAQCTDTATWHYLPFGPFPTAQALVEGFYEKRIHPNSGDTLFVGYDKTQTQNQNQGKAEGTPAGICGYVYTSPSDLYTELFVLVFPGYRGTHVASHMVGLLMRYALDLPSLGGLGLRRVQWSANVHNHGSIGLARKMGFRVEGVRRWARVLEVDKGEGGNGVERRKGDPRGECPGRDTVGLAICWDEWEEGGRERVEGILRL